MKGLALIACVVVGGLCLLDGATSLPIALGHVFGGPPIELYQPVLELLVARVAIVAGAMLYRSLRAEEIR